MPFEEISVKDIKENFIKLIADDYMLITAGNTDSFNTMTASWGGVGEMWGCDVSIIAVRPTRYTFGFLEESDFYTLCFFDKEKGKKVHAVCGSKSGRDVNKVSLAEITPFSIGDSVAFEEARIVMLCRKLYTHLLDPDRFLDPTIEKWYKNDYHKIYAGEIIKTLIRK